MPRSRRDLRILAIGNDLAIPDLDDALGVLGDRVIVGHRG